MGLARDLLEAVREPGCLVQRRAGIPLGHANVVLLSREADLLPRFEVSEAIVPPRAGELTRDPRVCGLPDDYEAVLVLGMEHRSDPRRLSDAYPRRRDSPERFTGL
jgi:hypothetical protein